MMRLRVLAVLVIAALIEGVARLGLLALEARGMGYRAIPDTLPAPHKAALASLLAGTTRYFDYDSTLGWALHPLGDQPPHYHTNAQGFRAEREYAPDPPPGHLRIAAFGDSFTHGDDVPFEDAWTTRLERPGVEVLNFGVPGYGLDQALLRYRIEGRRYHPHVVLIGFMAEDIERSVSVYRPFYHVESHVPLSKPRFMLDHDTLVLVPNPMRSTGAYRALLDSPAAVLPRLGRLDYYYRTQEHTGPLDVLGSVRLAKLAWHALRQVNGPLRGNDFNVHSEAFAVTVATLKTFVREVRADGAAPVILLFPPPWDLKRYWRDGTRSYDALRAALDRAELPYLDLVEAFDGCRGRARPQALAPHHYSALGNAQVAAHLAARVDRTGIRTRPAPVPPTGCDSMISAVGH